MEPKSIIVILFVLAVAGTWLFTEDANPLEIALGLAFGLFALPFIALAEGFKYLRKSLTNSGSALPAQSPVTHPVATQAAVPTNAVAPQIAVASIQPAPQAMQSAAGNPWVVSDYIVNVKFNDAFSASVSVFNSKKVAIRKLRAISPASAILMRNIYGREGFDLPDFQITNGRTVEDAVLETEQIGMKFIEDLLGKPASYFQATPTGSQLEDKTISDPETTARALAILRGELADEKTPAQRVQPSEPPAGADAAQQRRYKRKAIGITKGVVTEMGMRKMLFKGGASTFEATIHRDDGEFVSFRGVRLNELFQENGVKPGDKVEIEALGTTTVDVGDEKRTRNEFKVKILEAA
jgi:hypothetical protein